MQITVRHYPKKIHFEPKKLEFQKNHIFLVIAAIVLKLGALERWAIVRFFKIFRTVTFSVATVMFS